MRCRVDVRVIRLLSNPELELQKCKFDGGPLLHWACKYSNGPDVEYLLDRYPDMASVEDRRGNFRFTGPSGPTHLWNQPS